MARSISDIWTAVLESDSSAWSELVDMYSGLLYTVAYRAGLDAADSEDCVQHTWISLYRNRHTIRNADALPAWLIRTTHRRATYVLRRTSRRSELMREYPVAAPGVMPDEEVEQLEWQAVLRAGLSKLDPRCREIITALYVNETPVSYSRLARKLGVSINTLSPLRARCLKRLRQILEEMGYELH